MAETTAPPRPRYGKEVVGKRLKILSSKDNKWKTGVVKTYHGGYYRHCIEFDDGETLNTHLYAEDYHFLPEPGADPPPDLKPGSTLLSVYWPAEDRWFTGRLLAFDGFKHTVRYDDMDTEHHELAKEKYKVVDQSAARGKNSSSGKSKGEAAPFTAGGSAQKHRERQRSVPPQVPAGGGNGKGPSGTKASRPSSASAAAAAAAGGHKADAAATDKPGAVDRVTRASAERSPPEKQPADRGAAAGGYSKDTRTGSGDKERRSSSSGAAAAPASKQDRAAAAIAAANAAAGAANKKLPLLNMSHVSKKDREAARMLLGFSSPTGPEPYFTAQPLERADSKSGAAAAGGNTGHGTSAGRLVIAAAAAAAAAAAGLPDPTADFYPPSGGNSPAEGSIEEAAAAGDAVAAAAAAGPADDEADAAAAGGSVAVAALSSELLAGMQWQMQQLVQQEENRWVEVNRLNSQVARIQFERDDAVRARDSALVERDLALAQMKQLQDEKSSLTIQVDNLEREIVNLTSQLSVERGMISNASIDAAQLRVQLTGMRNELAGCKQEATQVIAAIRGIASAGYSAGMAPMPSMGYGTTHPGAGDSMTPAAAAAMMGMGAAAAGAYGNPSAAYGMMEAMDPAAAAAATVPAHVSIQKQRSSGLMRLGPTQNTAAAAAGPPAAAASAGGGASGGGRGGSEAGRSGGVGQLMQVGPGTLVVGPRRKGLVLDQTAVYTPTAAEAAAGQLAAGGTASQVPVEAAEKLLLQQQDLKQTPQQLEENEAAAAAALNELLGPQSAAEAPTAAVPDSSKPAGGHSSDINNGNTAAAEPDGVDTQHPAAAVAAPMGDPSMLDPHLADASGLTTSEAALAADDDDSVSEVAAADQSRPGSADMLGRRPGRPSRKPNSNGPVHVEGGLSKGHEAKPAGVEAKGSKKRTRGNSASVAGGKGRDAPAAAVGAAPVGMVGPAVWMQDAVTVEPVAADEAAPLMETLLPAQHIPAFAPLADQHDEAVLAAGGSSKAVSPAADADIVVADVAGVDQAHEAPQQAVKSSELEGTSELSEFEELQELPSAEQQQGIHKRQKVAV